jgi:hypothetical protein
MAGRPFGLSASSSSFNRLDHEDLRDGSFLTTANRFTDEGRAIRDRESHAHVRAAP